MGSHGKEVMISKVENTESSDATVEIKIKTLDSQTYTLRVDKCVPVPALKDQIATVTGVLSDQQRLICRGKVLRDDQLLSAYHVEDGHTLHLVVRQPIPPASESMPETTDSVSSPGHGSSVLVGTFNISEHGDGVFPDLNRLMSAVLSSIGMSTLRNGTDGVDPRESSINWLPRTPGLSDLRELGSQRAGQAATMGQLNSMSGVASSFPPAADPLNPLQPLVIPDSLTTLSQYLARLRNEFGDVIGDSNNFHGNGTRASSGQESVAVSLAAAVQGGMPTPATLAEVMRSTRQILVEQAAECLAQLTRQLDNEPSVTDPLERAGTQYNAVRSGFLLQNLGALLLELGRTTMTLRMGQSPPEAVVNAGPAVYISTSGPNPIMVQPLPFHPGTSFGTIPMASMQAGSGSSVGTLNSASIFSPRNIDITIRTGIANQRESNGPSQSNRPANVANAHHGGNGTSVGPTSSVGAEVRRVPIRTVVASVPARISPSPSDLPRGSVGILYPILARVQRVTPGNSQEQQPNSISTDGEGQSSVGAQENQGAPTLHSRLDHFFRNMFPGQEVQIGGDFMNSQAPATNSVPLNEETAEASRTTEEQQSRDVVNDGIFLSNLLRQIMPLIPGANIAPSESTEVLENPQSSQGQENLDVGTSSCRRDDPPSPQSKRQKRE